METRRVAKRTKVEWRCPLCPHAIEKNANTTNALAARKRHFARHHPDDRTKGWKLDATFKQSSLILARRAKQNAKAARTVVEIMKGTKMHRDIKLLLDPRPHDKAPSSTKILCRCCAKMTVSAVQLDKKSCQKLGTSPDNGKQKQERMRHLQTFKDWAKTARGEKALQAKHYIEVMEDLEAKRDQVAAATAEHSSETHKLRALKWRREARQQQ